MNKHRSSNGGKSHQKIKTSNRLALIVQSEAEALDRLRELFLERGDRVLTSPSLKDAGQKLEQHHPDIVVMDVALLGARWAERLPRLRRKFEGIDFLFTADNGCRGAARASSIKLMSPPFDAYRLERGLLDAAENKSDDSPSLNGKKPISNVRIPIRAKITLPFVILALLTAAAAAYVVTQILFDTIEERFTNQLIETGRLSAEWMVKEENRLLESMRLVVHIDGFSEAVEAGNSERLREYTYPVAVNAGLETLEILDMQGISHLSLRHKSEGRVEEYDVTKGEDFLGKWQFLQRVLNGEVDEKGNKFSGIAKGVWGSYFYLAGPIMNGDGHQVGVLLVGERLTSMVQKMRHATLAQITIYNLDGQPVASTCLEDPSQVDSTSLNAVLLRQDHESLMREEQIANIRYSEIIRPMEVRSGQDIALLGSSLPQTFLISSSTITRMQILVVVTVVFMLVITVGLVTADQITKPLSRVVRATLEVARGNLRVNVREGGNDEAAVLASSFNHMIASMRRTNEDLLEAYNKTILGWSKALEMRDEDTEGHTQRVTEMTVRLARVMGISEDELVHVHRGALLHDIGKIAIPDAILNKPGSLTDEEWVLMRQHPRFAYEMLAPIEYLRPALDIPCCHHERWDGTGYPYGLKGEEIPLSARIFAIIDVWDALCSDRPYRKAWPLQRVLEHLHKERGKHFDPEVVQVFMDEFRELWEFLDSGSHIRAEKEVLAGCGSSPALEGKFIVFQRSG